MFDVTVIGGGIVGLATALQIQKLNPLLRILLIEKKKNWPATRQATTAALFIPALLQTWQFKGTQLYPRVSPAHRLLQGNGIPYDLCGKIVVATEEKEFLCCKTFWCGDNKTVWRI